MSIFGDFDGAIQQDRDVSFQQGYVAGQMASQREIAILQSDLAAAKERESDLHRLLRAQSGLIEEQRQEIARAREALIKQWELVFTRSYSQNPIGRAEARYAREIAHTGEEVGNE